MDVEQILACAFGEDVVGNVDKIENGHELCIFFVDDSVVARKKITEVLDKMGVKNLHANNGLEGWERLNGLADTAQSSGIDLHDQIQVVLVDAEMPVMDGYVLTQHIKADKRFDGISMAFRWLCIRRCRLMPTVIWGSGLEWIITCPNLTWRC